MDFTQKSPLYFFSTDWGIHNQLLLFYGKEGKYYQIWVDLLDRNITHMKPEMVTSMLNPANRAAFIMHPENNTYYPDARTNLFNLARQNGYELILLQKIADNYGNTVFEIYVPIKLR